MTANSHDKPLLEGVEPHRTLRTVGPRGPCAGTPFRAPGARAKLTERRWFFAALAVNGRVRWLVLDDCHDRTDHDAPGLPRKNAGTRRWWEFGSPDSPAVGAGWASYEDGVAYAKWAPPFERAADPIDWLGGEFETLLTHALVGYHREERVKVYRAAQPPTVETRLSRVPGSVEVWPAFRDMVAKLNDRFAPMEPPRGNERQWRQAVAEPLSRLDPRQLALAAAAGEHGYSRRVAAYDNDAVVVSGPDASLGVAFDPAYESALAAAGFRRVLGAGRQWVQSYNAGGRGADVPGPQGPRPNPAPRGRRMSTKIRPNPAAPARAAKLYPWVEAAVPLAERELDVDLRGGEFLGAGASGASFVPAGRKYVVKLTRALDEARAVGTVVAMRNDGHPLDGIVTLARQSPQLVGEVPGLYVKGPPMPVWAVVKHRVDAGPAVAAALGGLPRTHRTKRRQGDAGTPLDHASAASMDWGRATNDRDRAKFLAEYLDWLEFCRACDVLHPLVDSLAQVARTAGPIYDAVERNLGFTTTGGPSRLVAFDFEFPA